jgi:hypothetical protein
MVITHHAPRQSVMFISLIIALVSLLLPTLHQNGNGYGSDGALMVAATPVCDAGTDTITTIASQSDMVQYICSLSGFR